MAAAVGFFFGGRKGVRLKFQRKEELERLMERRGCIIVPGGYTGVCERKKLFRGLRGDILNYFWDLRGFHGLECFASLCFFFHEDVFRMLFLVCTTL